MSELKCCPFCSSNNIKVGSVGTSLGIDNYIKCVDCGAKIQKCSEYGIEHLKELWNRRTPMANIVENIEKHLEEDSHNEYSSYYRGNYQMISVYDAIDTVKQEINNGLE